MPITRRAALLAAALPLAAPALAQPWPGRPIRVLVPFAPGGAADSAARTVLPRMGERLSATFVVENRTGAGGSIGGGEVARAAPDGFTLLWDASSHIVNHALLRGLTFDYATAFLPISQGDLFNYGIFILIYALLALGLNVVVGFAGLLDLGYVAFFGFGAYIYAFLSGTHSEKGHTFSHHWDAQYSIPVCVAICALLGLFLGSSSRRLLGDYLAMLVAALGVAVPSFVIGPILIWIFALSLGWLPTGGVDDWKGYLLPAVALALAPLAVLARYTRAAMLEVTGADYVRTARAKGLREGLVVSRHALKNALIPIVTVGGVLLVFRHGRDFVIRPRPSAAAAGPNGGCRIAP